MSSAKSALLSELLEARSAAPADVSPDGHTVLVLSNLSGTMQAYRLPATGGDLVPLTDFEDAVASACFLEDGRVLIQKDEGGNERHHADGRERPPSARASPAHPISIGHEACTPDDEDVPIR